MLTLSKQSDYALIILSQLTRSKQEYTPLSQLVDDTNLPQRFLARIAATLVTNGILISREGRIGGYKLSNTYKSISLYDFLKIFEKNLDFLQCIKHDFNCKYQKVCTHRHTVKTKLNDIVITQLKKTSLAELF